VHSGRYENGEDVHPSGRLGLLFSLIGVKLRSQESVVVWAEERVGMVDRGLRKRQDGGMSQRETWRCRDG
jgi:hypothetical protein